MIGKPLAIRMMSLLSGVIKGMAFYPESHPAIRQPLFELDKILASSLDRVSSLTWGILDGIMFFEDHLFIAPSTAIVDLTNRMIEKEIGRICISSGLSFEELQCFVRLLSNKSVRCSELIQELDRQGISHIRLEHALAEKQEENDQEAWDGGLVATYGQALGAVRGICREIEEGRIPASAPIIRVVDRLVDVTMQEPSTLLGLTMIKDYDNYTFNHCVNVGVLAMALGASTGLPAEAVRELGIAGQLHDIGKTMIPKSLLNKPGKLSAAEFDEMKRHSELGAKIVREMDGLSTQVTHAVLGHHLHYNRKGYPESARELAFNQMIDFIAIADTYDALTTLRAYQQPFTPRAALARMQELAGTFLDGNLLMRFIEIMGKYPVGTLVRLDNNEIAVVYRPNTLDEEAPVVKIIIDQHGERLVAPREQSLIEQNGSIYASIVASVDPLLKNIDVGSLMSSGVY